MEWLNGKKTLFGGAVLLASTVMTQVVAGIWGYEPMWMAPMVETLDWVGALVMAGGFTHKGLKRRARKGKQ